MDASKVRLLLEAAFQDEIIPLLSHAACLGDVKDQECGFSVLHTAARGNALVCVQFITTKYPHLTKEKDNEGLTPLHCACARGHMDTVAHLLSVDFQVIHSPDNSGWTPLHIACRRGHYHIVEFLLGKDGSWATEALEACARQCEEGEIANLIRLTRMRLPQRAAPFQPPPPPAPAPRTLPTQNNMEQRNQQRQDQGLV